MASAPPPVSDPKHPNVPQSKGVPPVTRSTTNSDKTKALTKNSAPAPEKPAWGLYRFPGGELALECDNVMAQEPSREARISDYQTEDGGFQTYNKMMQAGEIRVTVTKGGTVGERADFIAALNKLLESLDLFNVVAPDFTGSSYNLVRYDTRRTAESGASLLTIDLVCQEVRETAQLAYTDAKNPSGAEKVNAGPVQPTPTPPPTQPTKNTGPSGAGSNHSTVNEVKPVEKGASFSDKAKVISTIIQVGGTIYDLATKGISFQSIPTLVTAAQTLTTTLGGQSVQLDMVQKAFGLFMDVYVSGQLILGGAPVQADNPIVRSAYFDFLGELYLHDTQGGEGSPSFEELGSRYVLLYAGA